MRDSSLSSYFIDVAPASMWSPLPSRRDFATFARLENLMQGLLLPKTCWCLKENSSLSENVFCFNTSTGFPCRYSGKACRARSCVVVQVRFGGRCDAFRWVMSGCYDRLVEEHRSDTWILVFSVLTFSGDVKRTQSRHVLLSIMTKLVFELKDKTRLRHCRRNNFNLLPKSMISCFPAQFYDNKEKIISDRNVDILAFLEKTVIIICPPPKHKMIRSAIVGFHRPYGFFFQDTVDIQNLLHWKIPKETFDKNISPDVTSIGSFQSKIYLYTCLYSILFVLCVLPPQCNHRQTTI